MVRTARALERLPRIREAFRLGHISYSKVRAVTRVATPENEETLLNLARHGTASHVERLVGGYRGVLREEERQEANVDIEERKLSWYGDAHGATALRARLAGEVGARVEQTIRAVVEVFNQEAREGVSAETLMATNRAAGLDIDAGTAVTLWLGERMDYGLAVDGLMQDDGPMEKYLCPPGTISSV